MEDQGEKMGTDRRDDQNKEEIEYYTTFFAGKV